ncbi:hypothetical protein GCM10009092_11190 [Bowmanella denitrificans]|uniref:Alginate export domain-containing protein n=1 Tax=Bowmanella denitrificans TaxID=366582 RepID=A0ABN0WWH8_9ALTE
MKCFVLPLLLPLTVTAAPHSNLSDALTQGKANISLRYRTEMVDDKQWSHQAWAHTLRGRFGYHSGDYYGLSAHMELDSVTHLGAEKYQSTSNGVTDRPVIADPTGSDINQAYLAYQHGAWQVKAGRQRLNLDDQRFVGSVGWRQNEQTFDGYRLQYQWQDLSLDYSYFHRVNRIFGDNSPAGTWHGDIHLLNSHYQLHRQHRLTAFSYWMDFAESPALSNQTLGVTYNGEMAGIKITASLASQQDYAENPADYRAIYWSTRVAGKWQALDWHLGYERLGADAQGRIVTPLATLHKFQGFADKFLNTPMQGLQDSHAGLGTSLGNAKLQLTYHHFVSDKNHLDYGHEWDATFGLPVYDQLDLLVKYAAYHAGQSGTDTNKLWLMLSAAW